MSVRSFYVTRDTAEAMVELIEAEARVKDSTRISYLDLLYHDLRKRFGMMPAELPDPEAAPKNLEARYARLMEMVNQEGWPSLKCMSCFEPCVVPPETVSVTCADCTDAGLG